MSLATLGLFAVALALFFALLGLQLLGFRYGKRQLAADPTATPDRLAVVESAVFALLGLLLAFEFGGASGRLSSRRALAVREANAIGTTYLRLDLLPHDEARALRPLFREYLETRIRAIEAMPNLELAAAETEASEQQQQAIWVRATQACGNLPHHAPLLLLPSLNEMIDLAAERKVVAQTHSPILLLSMLLFLSLSGAAVAGFSMSRAPHPPRIHMLVFAVSITLTNYCIIDMNFPSAGFIRVGAAEQALYDLRSQMP